MADDDEFGALYGIEQTEQEAEALYRSKPQQAATEVAVVADEEDLYQQLYGVAAPAEELNHKVAAVEHQPVAQDYGAVDSKEEPVNAIATDALPGVAAAAVPGVTAGPAEEEEEDDDDFMVTLDENATAVEPQASRYQYQRHQAAHHAAGGLPGGQRAGQEGIGAAPGQHFDGSSDAAPGIPQGPAAFGSRTAIGGIPRSAIPGLGGGVAAFGGQPGAGDGVGGALQRGQPGSQLGRGAGGFRLEDAAFPSQAKPDQPIKLPGQTRVTPEEYREFLSLGHGEIFSVDVARVVDPPWRYPGIDPSDFFNYGMNERTWKDYCARVAQFRMEFTMQHPILTLDQTRAEWRRRMAERSGEQNPAALHAAEEEEDYAAFVTSERPPRPQWPRWGTGEEHMIPLAGGEVENPRPPAELMDYPHDDFFYSDPLPVAKAPPARLLPTQRPPPPAKPPPPAGPPPAAAVGRPGEAPVLAATPALGVGRAVIPSGVVKLEQQQERPRSPALQQQAGPSGHAGRINGEEQGPAALPPPHMWAPGGPPTRPPPNGHMRPPMQLPPIGVKLPDLAMTLPLPFMDDMGMPPDFGRFASDNERMPDVKPEERMKLGGLAEGMDIDIPLGGPRGSPRDLPPGRFGPPGGPTHFDRRPQPFDFRGPPPFRDRGYRDFDRLPPPPFGRPDDRGPPPFLRDGPGEFSPTRRGEHDFAEWDRDRRDGAAELPARPDGETSDRDRVGRRQRSRSGARERRRSRSRDKVQRARDREQLSGGWDHSRERGSRRDGSRERRADRDRGGSRHSRDEEDSRRSSRGHDSRDRDRDRSSRH